MPEELNELINLIVMSIALAIVFLIPVGIWRLIRGKAIYQGQKKLDSPTVLYVGIIIFGGFGVMSFATGKPFYGTFFLFFMGLFIVGLVAYNHWWKG